MHQLWQDSRSNSFNLASSDSVACKQLLESRLPQLFSAATSHSLQLVAAAGASAAAVARAPEPAALDVLCNLTGCIKECLQAASNSDEQQLDVNKVTEALECSGEHACMACAWHTKIAQRLLLAVAAVLQAVPAC
jgi:hypothetical protein